MRKRSKLLLALALAVLVIVTGTTGLWKALASAPSSGSPTALSAFGTEVIGTTLGPTVVPGYIVGLFISSTLGPFYVEKVNVEDYYTSPPASLYLAYIHYDNQLIDPVLSVSCSVVAPPGRYTYSFGDIISVAPYTMIDQTGARAIPAASGVYFDLIYKTCPAATNFPTGMSLSFEATVLAPTTATVSISASEVTVSSSAAP
jgi:hypothetical protein